MIGKKYSEILKENNELGTTLAGKQYSITILSNVIVHSFGPVMELALRQKGINAVCTFGNYDNIVQDSADIQPGNATIVFWELANMIDGFQYHSLLLDDAQKTHYLNRFISELQLVFRNVANHPLVLINKFSTAPFNHHFLERNAFDDICDSLNAFVAQHAPANVKIIDIDKLYSRISVSAAVDFRNYYSSKALYSTEFYKHYALHVAPVFLSAAGKAKKVLVFDCDNSLWNGILGEDGLEGIQMSAANNKGVVYEEVQSLAKQMAAKGIIIALNSKNNPADVDEVLAKHKDIVLKEDDIVIKKVNWNDKVSNLSEIARDLNVGLDSLVFVDDADFEIELVHKFLPVVDTIQVPVSRYNYPDVFRKHLDLFFNIAHTKEDVQRTRMYKDQVKRESQKNEFSNIEEYLADLNISIQLHTDDAELVPRMAQLTQKTNQFNLTTKRYTESEIEQMRVSENALLLAINVDDKFGKFGITGLAIVLLNGDEAVIDSLLLSCRIIGRKIEHKFFDAIIRILEDRSINTVKASYIKTPKNEQVSNLYSDLGFETVSSTEQGTSYQLQLNNYQHHSLDYISLQYGG